MTRIKKARKQINRVLFRLADNGCYIPINRHPNMHGYINTNFEHKQTKLHRLVAFAYLGLDIDNPLELALHKPQCNNRACFNKEHLYVGDHKQNMSDTLDAKHHPNQSKEFCPKGHRYDQFHWENGKAISRRCSQCRKLEGK